MCILEKQPRKRVSPFPCLVPHHLQIRYQGCITVLHLSHSLPTYTCVRVGKGGPLTPFSPFATRSASPISTLPSHPFNIFTLTAEVDSDSVVGTGRTRERDAFTQS